MRLLGCGSRSWDLYPPILNAIQAVTLIHGRPDVIIHGAARGADTFIDGAARYLDIPVESYPITDRDWRIYGNGAGPRRNQIMLDEGRPTHLIAFAPDFGAWSGTVDMCTRAGFADLPMACLRSAEEVEHWIEVGAPFGPWGSWIPIPVGGIGRV